MRNKSQLRSVGRIDNSAFDMYMNIKEQEFIEDQKHKKM